ncbi:hypothetical protein MSAN_00800900 [Mycena sanguinolenta]|uniref:F-box domain-containing protein n=1 Tax=Mycena sanguinolenta TaxID=230812 RepID=A0A8H6YUH4_9AGAR|nr:hypothetical protein MSAN_00800900 [Mycena sanguinolenta]
MTCVLPVEIWTQIHSFACTDDGSAGRALALVSKDWSSISAPFRFQSIALLGAKPILRFLCLLESTEESLRDVQSLFIGCPNLRNSNSRLDLARERALGLTFTEQLFPELGITSFTHVVQIHNDAIEQAVIRILRRTANTVRVLHAHLAFIQRPRPLYPIPLRRLRVLVLHGPFASPPPISTSTFPNLRRLRLAPPLTSPHEGAVLLTTIAAATPRLSHLCISHTACTSRELERALEHTNLRNLTRLIVEVGTSRRTPSPPANAVHVSEHTKLMRLAQDDGRVRIVREKRWWIDVQAALLEWEEADERWEDRGEFARNSD